MSYKALQNCKICEKPLMLGRFAHNQDTCWDCFKMKLDSISGQLKDQSDKEIIAWLKAVVAEHYREKL